MIRSYKSVLWDFVLNIHDFNLFVLSSLTVAENEQKCKWFTFGIIVLIIEQLLYVNMCAQFFLS